MHLTTYQVEGNNYVTKITSAVTVFEVGDSVVIEKYNWGPTNSRLRIYGFYLGTLPPTKQDVFVDKVVFTTYHFAVITGKQ